MAPKKAFLLLNVHVHKMNLWHLCEGFFWGRLYEFNLIPNVNSNKQIVNHNFTAFFRFWNAKYHVMCERVFECAFKTNPKAIFRFIPELHNSKFAISDLICSQFFHFFGFKIDEIWAKKHIRRWNESKAK